MFFLGGSKVSDKYMNCSELITLEIAASNRFTVISPSMIDKENQCVGHAIEIALSAALCRNYF